MARIKSLAVEKFRGIIDSSLLLDGKSLILHGENGHGKSSFIDALEFFFKGEVSHLQGSEGVSLDRHGPHALHAKDASKITLEIDNPKESVSRSFQGLGQLPAAITGYVDLGSKASFILRRRNLLGFIAAQAADRYTQLAELIGITDLDAVDLNLKRQVDEADRAVKVAKSSVTAATTNLQTALGMPPRDDATILSALNQKLEKLQQGKLENLTDIGAKQATIVARAKSPQDIARAAAIGSAKAEVDNLRVNLPTLESHRPFWEGLTAYQADLSAIREQAFQAVLTSSADLLRAQQPSECPICERPFDDNLPLVDIIARIQARLVTFKASTTRSVALNKLKNDLASKVSGWLSALRKCQGYLKTYLPATPWNALNQAVDSLSRLESDLRSELAGIALRSASEYFSGSQRDACLAELASASQQLENLLRQTAPTEGEKAAAAAVELLGLVETQRGELRKAQVDVAAKSAVQTVITAVYECFLAVKKKEVQAIFDDLQSDIRTFYDVIHPGEGHRAVSLILPPDRRASALIKMGFYHRSDEDPRGYNSEAHLDSLGLCIFLAFTKRFNGGFPLIVLDDVVSSVDAAHRGRVCKLLCENFPESQLVVTTHDYMWMEEWEAHQRALNVVHRFVNMRILNWSLEHGPTLDKYRPRWEWLKQKIEAGDREGAASEARRILEWLLLEMVFNIEAPIALTRDGKYTVAQLYDPLLARLKKLNKEVETGNSAVFKNLQINGIFGNLLTHNNLQAGNTSMAEVQALADAVTALHGLFYCTNCNQLVKYDRTDKELKCRCRSKIWATS